MARCVNPLGCATSSSARTLTTNLAHRCNSQLLQTCSRESEVKRFFWAEGPLVFSRRPVSNACSIYGPMYTYGPCGMQIKVGMLLILTCLFSSQTLMLLMTVVCVMSLKYRQGEPKQIWPNMSKKPRRKKTLADIWLLQRSFCQDFPEVPPSKGTQSTLCQDFLEVPLPEATQSTRRQAKGRAGAPAPVAPCRSFTSSGSWWSRWTWFQRFHPSIFSRISSPELAPQN